MPAVELILNFLEQDYEENKNPITAWKAVDLCAENRRALPDWVMTYLAAAASVILDSEKALMSPEEAKLIGITKRPSRRQLDSTREAEIVGKALGFGLGEGAPNKFSQSIKHSRDWIIYNRVKALYKNLGSAADAKNAIAEEMKLEPRTIEDACSRCRAIAGDPPFKRRKRKARGK